jgi:hypothetical protein
VAATLPKPTTSNAKAEGRFDRADFIYIARDDEYLCPAGLGGDRGLDIFTPTYPAAYAIGCGNLDGTSDAVEETVSSGQSGLQYDSTNATYTYVWKTMAGWSNTCRILALRFTDGSEHRAYFKFR